ncbi:MAG TPA: acyltransferase [Bacteroidia bacterium]|jgi:peptidoglycan/LPS O-acetylase OafA/YrhL|nr:acyltransferase [Bacteroidia bacterium]
MNTDNLTTPATYFPNLNGLRFVTAFAIMIIHIEHVKFLFHRDVIELVHHYGYIGPQLVSIFFVLSGFLITYLLLKEKKKTGTINFKFFYTRRLLRIWPLYYLVILVGFFILPHVDSFFGNNITFSYNNFWWHLGLYMLFLPALNNISRAISATWSVRVEEIFYFFWPIIIKKTANYIKVFLAIIIGVIALRGIVGVGLHITQSVFIRKIFNLIVLYRISCMAIGGLGAYLLYSENKRVLTLLFRKDLQVAVYIVTLLGWFYNPNIPFISFEVYSMLYLIIILNLALNPATILKLNYKWMDYLGKTSYGIYLYNPILRIICLEVIERCYGHIIIGWQMNLLLYAGTIASTLLISILSFELFESKFLRLKSKYSVAQKAVLST